MNQKIISQGYLQAVDAKAETGSKTLDDPKTLLNIAL